MPGSSGPCTSSPVPPPEAAGSELFRRALLLLATDPRRLGGAHLRTDHGPACDRWLAGLRSCLDPGSSWRRLPAHIDDESLLGGVDLTASLQCGRPIRTPGLLHSARGGALIAGLAERIEPRVAAQIAMALDAPEGCGFLFLALDGGQDVEESCPRVLTERLAVHLDLRSVPAEGIEIGEADRRRVELARSRCDGVRVSGEQIASICAAAAMFGIDSSRAASLALAVACANAAFEGRAGLVQEDLEWGGRLVLAARARVLPAPPEEPDAQPPEAPEAGSDPPPPSGQDEQHAAEDEQESVVEATRAAIPQGLLSELIARSARTRRARAGKAGASVGSGRRGRPVGVRAGLPKNGARLDLLATLRTAAPWQRLRRARCGSEEPGRVLVRAEDCRVRRHRERTQTLTLFVLDASGSNAMHRMAECKGAVELWLAECYVRRDQVAVVTFRGRHAELVVPPTRSLVRAKRSLAALAAGGPTPLSHGLELAGSLALQLRRRGLSTQLVILTDGHANVARDGSIGRVRAEEDARKVARRLGSEGLNCLLVDSAPRPQDAARAIAGALQARYLPLPRMDARALVSAVREAA